MAEPLTNPKISCLMVTANRKKLFRRSLLSYMRQTYKNTELVILDDGGEDLAPLLQDLPPGRIKYIKIEKKPENVLGHLRNMTLDLADGEFICQWDDDDWYHPDRLKIQYETLRKGCDACVLSNTLMHLDREPFFAHPYLSLFRNGTPGSIMHRRDDTVRYPAMRRAEDDVFLAHWAKRRLVKLPREYAHLFIRCFHGANTWDMKHFLEQMRNTLPDFLAYYRHVFFSKNLLKHPRFNLTPTDMAAFEAYMEDSVRSGIFK